MSSEVLGGHVKLGGRVLEDVPRDRRVNNITAVLSSLVRYAVRNKVIGPVDLSFMIKAQDTELVAVAPADVDKLAAAASDPRYRAAILLAADSGLRVGEIRALKWCEVNELGREIAISQSYDRNNELTATKGWERRVVPISDRLWSALKVLDRVGPLVVARLDGGPLGYDVTRETVREIYLLAGVAFPPKPWHSLRHNTESSIIRRTWSAVQRLRRWSLGASGQSSALSSKLLRGETRAVARSLLRRADVLHDALVEREAARWDPRTPPRWFRSVALGARIQPGHSSALSSRRC